MQEQAGENIKKIKKIENSKNRLKLPAVNANHNDAWNIKANTTRNHSIHWC